MLLHAEVMLLSAEVMLLSNLTKLPLTPVFMGEKNSDLSSWKGHYRGHYRGHYIGHFIIKELSCTYNKMI